MGRESRAVKPWLVTPPPPKGIPFGLGDTLSTRQPPAEQLRKGSFLSHLFNATQGSAGRRRTLAALQRTLQEEAPHGLEHDVAAVGLVPPAVRQHLPQHLRRCLRPELRGGKEDGWGGRGGGRVNNSSLTPPSPWARQGLLWIMDMKVTPFFGIFLRTGSPLFRNLHFHPTPQIARYEAGRFHFGPVQRNLPCGKRSSAVVVTSDTQNQPSAYRLTGPPNGIVPRVES